jgi:hypothetical protein
MKININEIKKILKSIDKEYGYFLIPTSEDLESLDIFNGTFIYYRFSDNLLEFEYSENGLKFNLYSDWYVSIDSKGNFKGKGSVRHKEKIKESIQWFLKIAYDKKYHKLLEYSPS